MGTTPSYKAWAEDSVFPSVDDPFFLDHVSRYYHAKKLIPPGTQILDVACGKGYGAAILAASASQVIGIDLNAESLQFARQTFGRANLEFRTWDVLESDQLGQLFDVIVAYEIIEHIEPEQTDRLLAVLKRSLSPGGRLLISTPNHEVVLKAGVAIPPFHINNLTSREFRAALARHFPRVELLGQYRRRGLLRDLVFHADYFSLRHRLRLIKKWLPWKKPVEKRDPALQRRNWHPSEPIPEVEEYRFSRWVRRQAGLSLAICSLE